MNQSAVIGGALIGGFVLYLAMNGRLSVYWSILLGKGGGSSGGSTSGGSTSGGSTGGSGIVPGAPGTAPPGAATDPQGRPFLLNPGPELFPNFPKFPNLLDPNLFANPPSGTGE